MDLTALPWSGSVAAVNRFLISVAALLCGWLALGLFLTHSAAGQLDSAEAAATPDVAASPAASIAPVWVNVPSHIYHYTDSRWYGRTARGKYLNEAEALAEATKLEPACRKMALADPDLSALHDELR